VLAEAGRTVKVRQALRFGGAVGEGVSRKSSGMGDVARKRAWSCFHVPAGLRLTGVAIRGDRER